MVQIIGYRVEDCFALGRDTCSNEWRFSLARRIDSKRSITRRASERAGGRADNRLSTRSSSKLFNQARARRFRVDWLLLGVMLLC